MLAIYARISKKKLEGTDTSIETQVNTGKELANSLAIEFQEYTDEGISGTLEIEQRPAFARMLTEIKDGKITAVYCYDQSRIERNTATWTFVQSLLVSNSCDFYEGKRKVDLSDPQIQLTATVMSAYNKFFAQLTGKKVSESIIRRAERGIFDGLKPYGYQEGQDRKLEINEKEAVVIKRIFKESLSGSGAYSIAKGLNKDGIPTRMKGFEGKIKRVDPDTGETIYHQKQEIKWRGNVVHDLIRNPVYKGEKYIKSQVFEVPAILSKTEWQEVNDNLEANKKNVGKKTYYKYLLNGLIVCGECGRRFVGKHRIASNDNSYKCKGVVYPNKECKTSRGINITKLDSFILKHLFKDKSLKKILQETPVNNSLVDAINKDIKAAKKQLRRKEREVKTAIDRLLDPDYENDENIKAIYSQRLRQEEQLKSRLKGLEEKYNDCEPNKINHRTKTLLATKIEEIDFDQAKKIIARLIERIEIFHHKEEGRIGTFFIIVKYRGYEEESLFSTSWKSVDWFWHSRIRGTAFSLEDLREDARQEILLWRDVGFMITPIEERPFKLGDRELTEKEKAELLKGIVLTETEKETIKKCLSSPDHKDSVLTDPTISTSVKRLIQHKDLKIDPPLIFFKNELPKEEKLAQLADLKRPYTGKESKELGGNNISLKEADFIDFN